MTTSAVTDNGRRTVRGIRAGSGVSIGVAGGYAEISSDNEGGSFNGGTITEPLVIDVPEGTPLSIRIDGEEVIGLGDSGGSAVFTVSDSIISDRLVVKADGGDSEFAVTRHGGLRLIAREEAPTVISASIEGTEVFRIDDDGSVHIKTGTSIVADL